MTVDTARFDREWKQESGKMYAAISRQINLSTIYGWGLITASTPVKFGRAKGSWLVTIDKTSDDTLPEIKKGSYPEPHPPKVNFDVTKNKALYITNNVNYIEFLEYGTSKMSPFAMVSQAVPKMVRHLNKGFKRLDNKDFTK